MPAGRGAWQAWSPRALLAVSIGRPGGAAEGPIRARIVDIVTCRGGKVRI
jgi:hypothetical protein